MHSNAAINSGGHLDRRRLLAMLGGAGAAVFTLGGSRTAKGDTTACAVSTPQVTQGPYWVDERLLRSDIRSDPATGIVEDGLPLALSMTVINSASGNCVPLVGAWVDIWHCSAKGIYSDESRYNPGGGTGVVSTSGQKFLRGYQVTDGNGKVNFTTIYPGWYAGRTIHIHVRIRTWSDSTDTATLSDYVTQLFFNDNVTNTVMSNSAYSRTTSRDTTNSNDGVYNGANNKEMMLVTLTQAGDGYAAAITIDASLLTATPVAPVINAGGVGSAASGVAGITPGGWTSIYGTDLAATSYVAQDLDLVNGYLPATLQNVSVQIDGKAAYVEFVSPTQINVQAPEDAGTGPVTVSVTNSAGMSNSVSATLQTFLPALFTQSGYLLAVRPSDSVIINGTGAAAGGYSTSASARAGDVLELYGTGFGPTKNSTPSGLVFAGADESSNAVTVSVGGQPATVLWPGLVAAGLWQINVQLPDTLASGKYPVAATVSGQSSPAGVTLIIAD